MKVKTGDTVVVLYDGLLDNGELFESSETSGPLEFIAGDGSVMAAFDTQVIGMAVGETKTFRLQPEESYGPSKPELIHTVDRSVLPGQESLSVGMILGLTIDHDGKKEQVPATVTAVSGSQVTVDFNHPLAGQPLSYRVTVQSIRPATDK